MSQRSLASQLADSLADGGWRSKARPSQLPPAGDWNGWLLMAGRGFGKTRTGAEWVKELVETTTASRIALIAPTAADARDVMVEGPAGILATASPWCRPEYEPSKRRLTWPGRFTPKATKPARAHPSHSCERSTAPSALHNHRVIRS
jgi:phage terminase large subunit-like protein